MKKIVFQLIPYLALLLVGLACQTPLSSPPPEQPAAAPPEAEKAKVASSYGKVPPYFIQNQGQVDNQVKYYMKGSRGTVYLTSSEVVYDFLREQENPEAQTEEGQEPQSPGKPGPEREKEKKKVYDRLVFRLKFTGANPQTEIVGEKELPGKINYFIGSQSNWRANIPTFEEVIYRDIYPGVDLKFYFIGNNLKYSITVKPGADPKQIAFSYEGIDKLSLNPEGQLVLSTLFGDFVEKSPRVYQEIGGQPVEREGSFKLSGDKAYTLDIPDYDSQYPLVIE